MGVLEPITHSNEIQELIDDAQKIYDNAKKEFESQKAKTTRALEDLGRIKVNAWSEGMDSFVSAFGAFKNIEMNRITDTNMQFIGCDEEPKQMLMNIENASLNANEVAKAGFASIGTGALVGVAAYGGAMMFGTASTGTAIAALSGAAKTNATLAWFGGGAKAVGGLGMAAGKLVLAGVVVAPIIAVAAVIAGAKGKERLAEAKKVHEEAENAVSKMKTITTGMQGIEKMSDNYSAFIKKLNRKFAPFIRELERIKSNHAVDEDGQIDFDSLSVVEQKTLHLSWLMAQIYYHTLATPILSSRGSVSSEAFETLKASKTGLKQVRKETFHMTGDSAPVGNLIWQPVANRMLIINSVAIVVCVLLGVLAMKDSIIKGILSIICAGIACPIFFKFRNMPASRLYVWRLVRLIIAVCILLVITIVM